MGAQDSATENVGAVCAAAGAAAVVYARTSRAERAQLLHAIADELSADREEIERLARAETALSPARLAGEMNRTINQARLFAGVLDDGGYLGASIDRATAATPDLRRTRVPIGAVAVFGASNFPLAFSVPGGDTVSALAAGCPVVVKAHPGHPLTSARTFEAMSRAVARLALPSATLSLVSGFEAGRELVLDPNIRAVGFTGSTGAGRALFDLASSRPQPIPFFGELGSLNPVVVTRAAARARGRRIAEQLATSISGSAGQLCTKPNLLFVPDADGDDLVEHLTAALRAVPAQVLLNDTVQERFSESAARWANEPGAAVLADGGPGQHGARLISIDVGQLSDAFLEESFGPAAVVVRYQDGDALPAVLDALGGQLTMSLMLEGEDVTAVAALTEAMTRMAGRLVFNDVPTGVAVVWSMTHGGPYPATTNAAHTSVGSAAIDRWLRPVSFQDAPPELLPEELRDDAIGIPRRVDGMLMALASVSA
ncbi:aldehyde dehydrogenase (NADP(+)) [Mycetocola sp. 2940]|uniref:aldehyde dehydrogenase (NADP(+)) n=1 Tax=Mycetocola sp. 2940 TaxID=3156452 RepID=UPI003392B623